MHRSDPSGTILLECGKSFSGHLLLGSNSKGSGEVVFTTGMTGYPETLTDPSFSGQIIVFTYPLLGNYGVPSKDLWESSKIHAQGVILGELAPSPSHHQSKKSLLHWLEEEEVPILSDVDTRALTRYLRSRGTIKGTLLPKEKGAEGITASELVRSVSCKEPILHKQNGKKNVALLDCGMKTGILRALLSLGVDVLQVPFDYDLSAVDYDGLLISNGPGDPADCKTTIKILQNEMKRGKPTFGICLGSQLMALASGAKTMKLPFGHRGQNQPCIDLKTKRCYITSQNHGYAVQKETLQDDWEVSFENLNDGSVEGIRHKTKPFFSVQFHPEASPGPFDTAYLFKEFVNLL